MAGDTPGPNPMLDDQELLKKIKQSILDGNDLRETARICGINESTFYVYHSDNVLNIADKIAGWKRDRKLMLANKNIEKILLLPTEDKDYVKVVNDMTKFVAETLGKDSYSKRSELTGADGKELNTSPLLVKIIDCDQNKNDNQSNGDTNGVPQTV